MDQLVFLHLVKLKLASKFDISFVARDTESKDLFVDVYMETESGKNLDELNYEYVESGRGVQIFHCSKQ